MARVDVKVPLYGMTESESYLVVWLVKSGDTVSEGDAIADVETSKAQTTIEAPASGVVGDQLIAAEEDIPVGAALTWIETVEV